MTSQVAVKEKFKTSISLGGIAAPLTLLLLGLGVTGLAAGRKALGR